MCGYSDIGVRHNRQLTRHRMAVSYSKAVTLEVCFPGCNRAASHVTTMGLRPSSKNTPDRRVLSLSCMDYADVLCKCVVGCVHVFVIMRPC